MSDEKRDFREYLASALDATAPEFADKFLKELLDMETLVTAKCPHCGKAAKVQKPDLRGIASVLATLADQGKGKAATAVPPAPKEASKEELEAAIRGVIENMTRGELAALAG